MDFLDLYIEALTGTRFHLRVASQERVFAIKSWIQRHEGIPVSHQHLIFGATELNDDATLASYEIPDKATLKLVVSMKGGPVRMRRVPTAGSVDPSWLEMRDLMDLNEDQLWDQAPGGKPVTVLLFRDGENVNFFRVVENSDGTYSPLSQTLNGCTLRSLLAEPDEDSAKRVVENNVLKEKMEELRLKMEQKEKEKSARKKERRRKRSVVVKPGSGSSLSSRRSSARTVKSRSSPRIVEIVDSPMERRTTPSVAETTSTVLTLDEISVRKETISRSSKASSRSGLKLPPITANNSYTVNKKYKVGPKVDTGLRNPVVIRKREPKINLSVELTDVPTKGTSANPKSARKKPTKTDKLPEPLAEVLEKPRSSVNFFRRPAFGSSSAVRPKTTPNLEFGSSTERDIVVISPALSTVSELGLKLHNEQKGTEIMNILNTSRSNKLHRAKDAQKRGALLRGQMKAKAAEVLKLDDDAEKKILNALRRLSMGETGALASLEKAVTVPVPVVETVEVARPPRQRCSVCRKKLGVASAFDCRCGGLFCTLHRYAEEHACTFDYKTEGRRQLQESNPLVLAQKLPKI